MAMQRGGEWGRRAASARGAGAGRPGAEPLVAQNEAETSRIEFMGLLGLGLLQR